MVKLIPIDQLSNCEDDSADLSKAIQKRKRSQKAKKVKIVTERDIDDMLAGSNEDTMTTEDYFKQVHEFFKTQNKKNPTTQNRMKEYILEKVCEVCRDFQNEHLLLLCDYCDDAYHTYCLQPRLEEVPKEEVWCCPECLKERQEKCLEIDENTQMILQSNEGKNRSNPSTSTKKSQRQTKLEEHYEKIRTEKEKELVELIFKGFVN